ncbi:MAG TPA: porin, partial [Cyclobacteriaceae bacterium]|nr:porin [Cyclobacteriaceae bacterium]
MTRFIFIAWLNLIINSASFAQQDSLSPDYFSIENLPEFTFGSGLGIMPRDSSFLINFRFRMQNRISFDADGNGISRVEARIRRLRLRFDGFILDPRITYALQLSFAPEDIMDYMEDSPPNLIRDAVIYFSPNRHWTLGFGQTKLPGNRERINSSGDLQLADRSPANSIFNIDRDFGIQVVYRNDSQNKLSYAIKGALTTGEGRNWVSSPGTGFSYTARLEILPAGTFHRRGDFFQGDLVRESKPKMAIGLVYNFNDDARREAGQQGDLLFDTRDIRNI